MHKVIVYCKEYSEGKLMMLLLMRRILSEATRERDLQEEFEGQAKLESFRFDLKTASESWDPFRLRNVDKSGNQAPAAIRHGGENKMKNRNRLIYDCLVGAIMMTAGCSTGTSNSGAPLVIAEQGFFFVGGPMFPPPRMTTSRPTRCRCTIRSRTKKSIPIRSS